jgi:hypothetical protein
MVRPPLEVADVIRAAGRSFVDRNRSWLNRLHLKVLTAIERCRTAALGGHVDQCAACGHQAISYNSCRNRHCPKCQAQARDRWLAARERDLLDVPYVHVVFTLPHGLLSLTNDLDLETLELLEEQLVAWPGTLLLVSHDRAFLDNVVTSTFVFEGDGIVEEYVGGYEDWQRQIAAAAAAQTLSATANPKRPPRAPGTAVTNASNKLSYLERRELNGLPARIEALETEQHTLGSTIADPAFYMQPAATIREAIQRVQQIDRELADLYGRWDALGSRSV